MKWRALQAILFCLLWAMPAYAQAPAAAPTPTPAPALPAMSISVGGGTETGNVSTALQIAALMTLLSLGPSIVMLMTSFTRIVIVLGFVRSAIGVQGAPSNQVLLGMSLFLTIFIMAPIGQRINAEALQPYMAKEIDTTTAMERAVSPLRQFMIKQARPGEIDFFLGLAGQGPTKAEDVSLSVLCPAFVISELRTAFQMGFLVFIPFLVIDFIVASTLMSMGMMMMPPVMISLPFKLLLFVLVDGWHLVVRSLVEKLWRMNIEQAIELLRGLITTTLLIISPILLISVVIGLLVSLFQAVTSIQEQTLSFVPKLLAVALALVIGAPWMLRNLMQFTTLYLARMAEMVR